MLVAEASMRTTEGRKKKKAIDFAPSRPLPTHPFQQTSDM
jgi:hypothetical protein